MITIGMNGKEIRRQIELDLPWIEKMTKRSRKRMEKEIKRKRLTDPIHAYSATSVNKNNYIFKTFVWKGRIVTFWLCAMPVWGKGVDYIAYKRGEITLFTCHVAKRLKERVFMVRNQDPDPMERIAQSAMAVMALFHPGENYPGMVANKGDIFTSKMRIYEALADEPSFLIKCLHATLVAKVEEEGFLRIKTALSDRMLAENRGLNTETFTFLYIMHVVMNPKLHPESRFRQAKVAAKAMARGIEDNDTMFFFNTLPGGDGRLINGDKRTDYDIIMDIKAAAHSDDPTGSLMANMTINRVMDDIAEKHGWGKMG